MTPSCEFPCRSEFSHPIAEFLQILPKNAHFAGQAGNGAGNYGNFARK
jgi:hypothetical protein